MESFQNGVTRMLSKIPLFGESAEDSVRNLVRTLGLRMTREETRTMMCQYGVIYDARFDGRDHSIKLFPHEGMEFKTTGIHSTSLETMMSSLDVMTVEYMSMKLCVAVMPLAMAVRRKLQTLNIDMVSARDLKPIVLTVYNDKAEKQINLMLDVSFIKRLSDRYRAWLRLKTLFDSLSDEQKTLFKALRFQISDDTFSWASWKAYVPDFGVFDDEAAMRSLFQVAQMAWLFRIVVCTLVKISMLALYSTTMDMKTIGFVLLTVLGNLFDVFMQVSSVVRPILEKVFQGGATIASALNPQDGIVSFAFIRDLISSVGLMLSSFLGSTVVMKILEWGSQFLSSSVVKTLITWITPVTSFTITLAHVFVLVSMLLPGLVIESAIVSGVLSLVLTWSYRKRSPGEVVRELLGKLVGERVASLVVPMASALTVTTLFSLMSVSSESALWETVRGVVMVTWSICAPIMARIFDSSDTSMLGRVKSDKTFAQMYVEKHPLRMLFPDVPKGEGVKYKTVLPPMLKLTSSSGWFTKLFDEEFSLRELPSVSPATIRYTERWLKWLFANADSGVSMYLVRSVVSVEHVLQIVVMVLKSIADMGMLASIWGTAGHGEIPSASLTDCSLTSIVVSST